MEQLPAQVWEKIGIPKAFVESTYEMERLISDLDKVSAEGVRRFLGRESLGLYMYGVNGSGKTTLACEIMKHFIEKKVQCFRGDIHHFMSSFKQNDWAISPKYVQPTIVVIDEIGKDLSTKYDILTPNLERLLQYRFNNSRPTILCSNIGVEELGKLHGPTVKSLVLGNMERVIFPNVDRRI